MLSILALGMLVAVGAAFDGTGDFQSAPHDGGPDGLGGHDGFDGHGGHDHDLCGNKHYDWLNPVCYTYSYSQGH